MTKRRRSDTQSQLDRLEHKHSELCSRVEQLDRHVFLSAQEQLYITELKKEKLATKDAIFDLRRTS